MFLVNSLYSNIIQVSKLLCVYTSDILENYINNWQYLDDYIDLPEGINSPIQWKCVVTDYTNVNNSIEFRYDNVNDPLSSHNPPYYGLKINYILLYNQNNCLALYKLDEAYYSEVIEFNELAITLRLSQTNLLLSPEVVIDYSQHISDNENTHRVKFNLPNRLVDDDYIDVISNSLESNIQCNNETQIIKSDKKLFRVDSTYREKISDVIAIKSGLEVVKLYKPQNVNYGWSNDSLSLYNSTIIKDQYDHYWEISNPYNNPIMTSLESGRSLNFSQVGNNGIQSIDYIDGNIIICGMNVYQIDSDNYNPSITKLLDPSGSLNRLLIGDQDDSIRRVHVMDSLTFDTYIYDIDSHNTYTFKSRNFHNLLVSLSDELVDDFINELHGKGIVAITEGLVIYSLDNESLASTDIHGHIKSVSASELQGGIEIKTPEGVQVHRINFDDFILLSRSLFIYKNSGTWYVNEIGPRGELLHNNLKLGYHSYDLLSINKFRADDLIPHDQQPVPKTQIIPVNYKGRLLRFDYDDNVYSTDYYFIKRF